MQREWRGRLSNFLFFLFNTFHALCASALQSSCVDLTHTGCDIKKKIRNAGNSFRFECEVLLRFLTFSSLIRQACQDLQYMPLTFFKGVAHARFINCTGLLHPAHVQTVPSLHNTSRREVRLKGCFSSVFLDATTDYRQC